MNILLTAFFAGQEFKNALREDAVDYSTYTANIPKRKRPTPRKGRKVVQMAAANDDDDDDDDEMWTGGVRKQSISVRKSINTRSRQRL